VLDRRMEILDSLNKIEKELPVENLQLGNMQYWPIIKIKLFSWLIFDSKSQRNMKAEDSSLKSKLSKKFLPFLKTLHPKYMSSLLKTNKRNLILSTSVNRHFKLNEHSFDYFLDPIFLYLQENKRKTTVWSINESQSPHSTTLYKQAFTNIFYLPAFLLSIAISPIFVSKINKHCKCLLQPTLSSQLQITIPNSLIFRIIFEFSLSKLFQLHFRLFGKPSRVFTTTFYSKWGFIHALNSLKIPVYDVQHGVQSNYHSSYTWNKILNTLPSNFLSWSKQDAEHIQNWGGSATAIGNPFISYTKNHKNLLALPLEFETIIKESGKPVIIISLQWGTKYDFLSELLKNAEYFYLIRFHPGMSQQEKDVVLKIISDSNNKSTDIKFSNQLPLVTLLINSSLHITCYSSVVIEADLLNTPSLCLSGDSKKLFSHLKSCHYLEEDENIHEKITKIASVAQTESANDFSWGSLL